MHLPPNELYSAFSFIGFVLSVIPFYWHFKARNTGTCLFMIWTGLGCLLQCINSIVWNKNMINRAPVYCDIATRIQVALNVADESMGTTDAEDRRHNVLIDILIGVGIPVLQMTTQYVVSTNRYIIFEDFGPYFSIANMLPTFFLFYTWPLAIGIVSLFYCVINIYTFYRRGSQCERMMSSTTGFSRSRYLRLIAISSVEVFATIPLSTFFIVSNATSGIVPWKSWADTHSHYSVIQQVPGSVWENIPEAAMGIEIYRWSLVACAFIFFALFGFAVDAREHYYRVYKLLARCVGCSMFTPHGAPRVALSVSYVKSNRLESVTMAVPIMVTTSRHQDSLSLTDQSSMSSISTKSTLNPNYSAEQASHSDTVSFYHSAKSFNESEMQGQSSPPAGILLTAASASVDSGPLHFSNAAESMMPVHAPSNVETV